MVLDGPVLELMVSIVVMLDFVMCRHFHVPCFLLRIVVSTRVVFTVVLMLRRVMVLGLLVMVGL